MSSPKVLRASYNIEDVFCIPKNIDLEDETQVKDWGVKWSKLFITLTNGKELIIKSWNQGDYDSLKYPNDTEIIEAEDYGCIDDDDEGFDEVEISDDKLKIIHSEKYCKVMHEIKYVRKLYDPLIIVLKEPEFWCRYLMHGAAICNASKKVDLNYFNEVETYPDPNSALNKLKTITLKVSGTEIEFK